MHCSQFDYVVRGPYRDKTRLAAIALFAGLALTGCLKPATPAETTTPTKMLTGATLIEVERVLRGYGTVEREEAGDGTPVLVGRMGGYDYQTHFYGCDDAGRACKSIQLTAYFDPEGASLDRINMWNLEKRFGKAYLDTDGDAVIEMDVNLDFGVTLRNFDDTVDYWRTVLIEFAAFLYGEDGDFGRNARAARFLRA